MEEILNLVFLILEIMKYPRFFTEMYRLWANQLRTSDERGNTHMEYMKLKQDKLKQQLLSLQENTIFAGLTFLLDGKLEPSPYILKNIIGMCGGNCIQSYSNQVTHVVSLTLSNSTYERYSKIQNIHLIYPQYIIDCNEKQILLDPNLTSYKYCHQRNNQEQVDYNFSKELLEYIQGDQSIDFLEINNSIDVVAQLDQSFPSVISNDIGYQPVTIDIKQIFADNNILYKDDNISVISPKRNVFEMQKQTNTASPQSELYQSGYPMSDASDNHYYIQQYESQNAEIRECQNEINQKLDIEEYLILNRPFGPQPQQSIIPRSLSKQEQGNLKNIPMCVCDKSVNKKNIYTSDAIILSINNMAKQLNLQEGMLVRNAYKNVENLVIFNYNYKLYLAYAKKFYKAISGISNSIMPISLDKCYLDVTGIINLSVGVKDISTQLTNIRHLIQEQCTLNVSVGLGTQLITAKIAYQLQHIPGQNKSMFLSTQAYQQQIKSIKIESLIHIPQEIKNTLYENDLITANDIRNTNQQTLNELIGYIQTQYLKNIVNGNDVIKYYPIKQLSKYEQDSYKVIHDVQYDQISIKQLDKICFSCLSEIIKRMQSSKQRKQIRQLVIVLKIQELPTSNNEIQEYKYEKLTLDLQNDDNVVQLIAQKATRYIASSVQIKYIKQIIIQCMFSGQPKNYELIQQVKNETFSTMKTQKLCNFKRFNKHIQQLKHQLLEYPNALIQFDEQTLFHELSRVQDFEIKQQLIELLITQVYLINTPQQALQFIIKHLYATELIPADRIKQVLFYLKTEIHR